MSVPAESLADAAAEIRRARRLAAACHENPDADTVAGALALVMIGARLGQVTEAVSADPIPASLGFMPGASAISMAPSFKPDVLVVCDAATLERTGSLMQHRTGLWATARVINIDHHTSNTMFGDVNVVDPDAAATCEVLCGLLPALDLDLDQPLATVLLAGIVRDTQGFSDASTTPRTLEAAASLVAAGASLSDIYRRVIGELAPAAMTLWGRVLAGMKTTFDGSIAYALLTEDMLTGTGTSQADADGVVEFMLRSRQSHVALLLRVLGSARTRISVRTSEGVDATRIVRPMGGGGHRRRAGCIVERPVAEVLATVLASTEAVLANSRLPFEGPSAQPPGRSRPR